MVVSRGSAPLPNSANIWLCKQRLIELIDFVHLIKKNNNNKDSSWTQCNRFCGFQDQTRLVSCVNPSTGMTMSSSLCTTSSMESARSCANVKPCEFKPYVVTSPKPSQVVTTFGGGGMVSLLVSVQGGHFEHQHAVEACIASTFNVNCNMLTNCIKLGTFTPDQVAGQRSQTFTFDATSLFKANSLTGTNYGAATVTLRFTGVGFEATESGRSFPFVITSPLL